MGDSVRETGIVGPCCVQTAVLPASSYPGVGGSRVWGVSCSRVYTYSGSNVLGGGASK